MVLFALAVAPGIAICFYIFFRDQYNPEPRKHLLMSFFLGVVSALPALLIQYLLLPVEDILLPVNIFSILIKAFVIVAFSEELCKYVMLRYYAYRQPEFDEPFDGIVYGVMVSMGFATIENIAYVMQSGYATAIVRMFISVPAHACFGILMGYNVGKARFHPGHPFPYLMKGLLLAIFFHGSFDFFLFLKDSSFIKEHVSDIFLLACSIVLLIFGIRLSAKAIRSHMLISKEMHGKNSDA
ncbi:PrsW family intramembrane metalloprotease [Pollutibacter soli]|uniref:PrsW family intramembrane metalloprotease n=1 Tax=Pollutibacter soli TaxID=3034157 RepID=UPI003013EE18